MSYNFDEIIDRENTAAIKYEYRKTLFGQSDVMPFWVADMDFRTPDFIIRDLKKRLEHEVLGYPMPPDEFKASIITWLQKRHRWEVHPEWITINPGVVPTLGFTVLAFTDPGDEVIIQSPVYYPFYYVIEHNGRKILNNPLMLRGERYTMDLDDLEKKITPRTKMIFLCNPHNPGGSVWREEELRRLAGICLKHGILMISDEIHSDLILFGNRHIPLASLGEDIAAQTITCLSASKTFNLAGMATSYTVTSNSELRKKLADRLYDFHLSFGNILGMESLRSAYQYGEDWLEELLTYIEGNIKLMEGFIDKNLREIRMIRPEGTYLVWLDFNGLGMDRESLKELLVKKAGIGLSEGDVFGKGGEGFQRWNVACPRSILEKGLYRLFDAVKEAQEEME